MNNTNIDKTQFSDNVSVHKQLATYDVVEGVEVPIVHTWGHGFDKYPKRAKLANVIGKFNQKVFGVPFGENFFGSETLIVEKMKEVYMPGIGNDAVDKLANKGYNYRQIAKKIGLPVVKEIHISHAIKHWRPGWLNLMLNEGIIITWELLKEGNAIDYFTNALARVGVGNSTTAAVATQTSLIGGSTAFVAQEATYPLTTTPQRIDFKGSFGNGVAEFAWEEFTVDNGVTPNDNLQRLVTPKGTKSAGETWTAEIQITGS